MTTPIIPPAPKVQLSDMYKSDPVLSARVAAERKEAQDAMNTLKQSRIDLNTQRKDMAMQRVQRIKASIKALKMSGIIDSKVLARMAARLAKELASAVKEYIAAGGKPDLVNAISDTGKTGAEINAAGGIEGEEAPTEEITEDSQAFVDAVQKEAEEAAQKYQQVQDGETNTPKQPAGNKGDDDKAFFNSVREAVEELRKIIKGHKRITDAFGVKEEPEFKQAENALREVERLISTPSFGPATASV